MPTCVECGKVVPRESMFGAGTDLRCADCASRRRQAYAPPVRRTLRVDGYVTIGILAVAAMAYLGGTILASMPKPRPFPPPAEFLAASPGLIWDGEIWRLATSVLIHGSFLHLLFNGYWLWRFGPVLEAWMGRVVYILFLTILATTSVSAEILVHPSTPIGLSGVVYGMFGFLFALRKQKDFAAALMDPSTVQIMIGWFFLCILLTSADLLPVANFAHGAGALLGYALGWAWLKHARIPTTAIVVAIAIAISTASTYMPWDYHFCQYKAYQSLVSGNAKDLDLWQHRMEQAWNAPAQNQLEPIPDEP